MTSKVQEDESQLVDNDELNHAIQPHLRGIDPAADPSSNGTGTTSLEYINPTLDTGESYTDDAAPQQQQQSIQNSGSGNGSTQNSGNSELVSSPPVYYSNRTGESVVVSEPVVIRHPNGVHIIRTRHCCELAPHRHRQERPLKKKHMKLLQAFSIVSILIFFPLGIPAAYYAFKCEKEFEAGIMRGDIDLARKYAKRSERFMIFSILAALLVAVAVFALVEREIMKDDEDYWKNRNSNVFPHG